MRSLSRSAPRLRASSMALLLALAAGCATPPGHPALEQADAAVERARRSPRVRALAASELDRAEVALQVARDAARAGAPPDRVEHLVYIVNQRAALAEARATQQVARSEIAMLDRVIVQGRPEQSRQRRASFPARDRQARAPLQLQARPSPAENRPAQMPPQAPQQAPALWQESRQADAPLREARRVDVPVQASRPTDPSRSAQEAPQGRGAVKESRRTDPLLQEPQPAARSAQKAPEGRGAVKESRQADPVLQEPQQAALSAQEAREAPGAAEDARTVPGPIGAQETAAAEPGPAAADAEAVPPEITLRLAQLSFAGVEPTSETGERLAAVAEQLLREPERSVSIEAEFNLPDPEARTTLEQRVEIVRAILLRRGIAPARLVVRASGDHPAEPRAKSPYVAGPY